MKVELVRINGHWRDIVDMASISHDNEGKIKDYKKLLHNLYKWGHMEPFEFMDFVWKLEIPIFLQRQLLRHRMSSRVERSMRYVELKPSLDDVFIPKDIEKPKEMVYKQAYWSTFEAYDKLIKSGVPKEQARAVLPLGLNTKMFVKFNARSFDNFLKLRLDKHAQPEMQQLARLMLSSLAFNDATVELFNLWWTKYVVKEGLK